MPTIQGITMSKTKADNFVKAVFEAAEDHGYCTESVTNVLTDLGFDVPNEEGYVNIRVYVSNLPPGTSLSDLDSGDFEVAPYYYGNLGESAEVSVHTVLPD